jgi:hypothetical protein
VIFVPAQNLWQAVVWSAGAVQQSYKIERLFFSAKLAMFALSNVSVACIADIAAL